MCGPMMLSAWQLICAHAQGLPSNLHLSVQTCEAQHAATGLCAHIETSDIPPRRLTAQWACYSTAQHTHTHTHTGISNVVALGAWLVRHDVRAS
eukprot:1155277-Pelagomonas_calceolata.AAC.4